jgi:hypothetical protein
VSLTRSRAHPPRAVVAAGGDAGIHESPCQPQCERPVRNVRLRAVTGVEEDVRERAAQPASRPGARSSHGSGRNRDQCAPSSVSATKTWLFRAISNALGNRDSPRGVVVFDVRRLLPVVGVVVAALTAAAAWSAPAGAPGPSCASIIVPGGQFEWRPQRVVLGVVSVPPAYIPQTVNVGGRWPFWSKSGLVVRANQRPVLVSVPRAWRTRVAISWGDARVAGALVFPSCPPSSSLGDWNPYAGGFHLRSRAACVPLTIRVGDQSATVRFGIVTRCR